MTSTRIGNPTTARSLLFDERDNGEPRDAGEAIRGHDHARHRLEVVRRLASSVADHIDRDVGAMADDLVDLDLGDLLVAGWRRHSRLVEAARRTAAAPGTEEVALLATHRVTSVHHPHVDLYVDDTFINSFEFLLEVHFDVVGAAAVVRAGELVALHGGECTVTARLLLEDAQLAKRHARVNNLAVMVVLDPPRPLLTAPPARHKSGPSGLGAR
ncbi:hypothetical protein IEZ26_22800 [Nocardioides cavernae]|uniref:Uncharacterized protein n=1 Tax=Nocardioides cavernae TaxID=1921566 RepID=A0ABR8NH59_9ACTN|nr:hypothetical protein [Nocardioides cavernae]MBD3927470.1 hypothetical protein [Nocardioides cavernae]MBM7513209.1 hypothetical protein [Nocardioides cavernae]